MKVTTDSCLFGAWAAKEIADSKSKIEKLLDIGTGSGLLSLMIAQKNDLSIDAVEIDEEAAEQAKENVEASLWKNRIHVFNEDILSFQPNKKYDCIISNPPFYENELTSDKQKKNIAHHSRQLTIAQILQFIKKHLNEDGIFFLMYPFKRKKDLTELFDQNELHLTNAVTLHQSVNHSPFRMIVKGTNKYSDNLTTTSIPVWNEHQQYTESFVELLKDYYLYL